MNHSVAHVRACQAHELAVFSQGSHWRAHVTHPQIISPNHIIQPLIPAHDLTSAGTTADPRSRSHLLNLRPPALPDSSSSPNPHSCNAPSEMSPSLHALPCAATGRGEGGSPGDLRGSLPACPWTGLDFRRTTFFLCSTARPPGSSRGEVGTGSEISCKVLNVRQDPVMRDAAVDLSFEGCSFLSRARPSLSGRTCRVLLLGGPLSRENTRKPEILPPANFASSRLPHGQSMDAGPCMMRA
jgi:hypothetical protein